MNMMLVVLLIVIKHWSYEIAKHVLDRLTISKLRPIQQAIDTSLIVS
jgi:hypothetical protein